MSESQITNNCRLVTRKQLCPISWALTLGGHLNPEHLASGVGALGVASGRKGELN